MGFIKRKPVGAADTDEPRPRNRLSKPMTSKPPNHSKNSPDRNKSSPISHELGTSYLSLQSTSKSSSSNQSEGDTKPQSLNSGRNTITGSSTNLATKKGGVASLVMQFETAASTSQLSLASPALSQRPTSTIYGAKPSSVVQKRRSMQSNGSKDQSRSPKHSTSTLLISTTSLDKLADQYAIPRRRASNYRPGEATRKPSMQEVQDAKASSEQKRKDQEQRVADQSEIETKFEDGPESWTPPPPAARTETPTSFNVKALGTLRLGSLRVVNGRSSPVVGEICKDTISRQLRDVSSEYADSVYTRQSINDTWDDAELDDETEPDGPPTPTRSTYANNAGDLSTPDRHAQGLERPGTWTGPHTPTPSDNNTSMLAQSYIDEIRGSPFSLDESSPLSTGSIVHHQQHEEEKESPSSNRQHDLAQNLRNCSAESKQESVESITTSVQTAETRNDAFTSALEFQPPHFQPPPSPRRGPSTEHLRPESVAKASEKADSGYYSGASMLSLNLMDQKPQSQQLSSGPEYTEIRPDNEREVSKNVSPKKEASPRRLGGLFPLRPAFKRSSVTESAFPTTSDKTVLPSDIVTPAVTPVKGQPSPDKSKKERGREEKKSKIPKRLQKSQPPSSRKRRNSEIVVQRLPSGESTIDLPAIPDVIKANLNRRSLQVPELEKTYKSQDHVKDDPNPSLLALPLSDIRFPSPGPSTDNLVRNSRESAQNQDRSKERPRSKSRRRSFFDIFRSDKSARNQDTKASTEDNKISIADFGDVVVALGANPYDIAQSRETTPNMTSRKASGPRTNPHDITSSKPLPRASMDDKEASEYARIRSHSFNHHHSNERRASFNERVGLLGKSLKTSMVADDAPPMPPLPTEDQLKRISLRQGSQSPYPNTPSQVRRFWEEGSSPLPQTPPELQSSPPPPPPKHSPLPAFIDHHYESEHAVEEEMELPLPPSMRSSIPIENPALPPPSHSPRPINLDHERETEDSWEVQARLWQARRQSAGEALRSHRQSLDYRSVDGAFEEDAIVDQEDEVYPAVPPRHPNHHSPYQGISHRWQHDNGQYDQNHYHHHWDNQIAPNQTWNENGFDDYQYPYQHPNDSHLFEGPDLRQDASWNRSREYLSAKGSAYFYDQQNQGSRQSNSYSRDGDESRQSFCSHKNYPIDRPFDPPPTVSKEFGRRNDVQDQYYTPQTSPVRDLRYNTERQYHLDYDHSYHDYNNYHDPGAYHQSYGSNQSNYYQHDEHANDFTNFLSQQYYDDGYESRIYQANAPQPSPTKVRRKSLAPPPSSTNRPTSQHSQRSFRSNRSNLSMAEELHPEIHSHPSQAPEFGRYSGGLGYGYEGPEKGFAGSAGTRTVSGKAAGAFKGKELRSSYGVDLGDVPIIGVVKKVTS